MPRLKSFTTKLVCRFSAALIKIPTESSSKIHLESSSQIQLEKNDVWK